LERGIVLNASKNTVKSGPTLKKSLWEKPEKSDIVVRIAVRLLKVNSTTMPGLERAASTIIETFGGSKICVAIFFCRKAAESTVGIF
jgi:hypothetical protein